jgi:glycosyltransferase involved in cell wall biosynthesis
MAVYNGDRFVRDALESILWQTYTNFEFIIINDGSTDNSGKILEEYAAIDSRIRLVSRENRGLTVSLNEGITMARGEFLARMDADDISLPQRFDQEIAHLRAHPELVLVGSRVLLIDPDGLPIREACDERTHEEIDQAHLNRRWPVVHPVVMMRTEAVRQVGGYRDRYNTLEDLDLFLRLAEVGKLANLPQVLLKYRQHFGSVTHSKEQQQMRIRQSIYDEAYARRGLPTPEKTPAKQHQPRRKFEQHSYWAWSALKAGNIHTARKHALVTVRQAPWWPHSWLVLACALRGH